MTTLYFEDLEPDRVIITPSFTLTEQDLIEFAQKYDPQAFHLDAFAAARSVFGGLVASGFQTAALAWKLATQTGCFEHSSIAGVGIDELRWIRPFRVNDTVTCTLKVISIAPSTSKPDRGTALILYEMFNQEGEQVLTFKLTQVVRRRAQAN